MAGGTTGLDAMTSVIRVKREPVDAPTFPSSKSRRRSFGSSALAGLGACALLLGACGGDDDDGSSESTTTTLAPTVSIATPTTVRSTTTLAPATTTLPPLVLVTEGAVVVVANASGVDGAAGRMTDALAEVGFSTGTATNSSEGQIETTKIYYDPENADAKAVADSLREALGGGDIEVLELVVPAPTDSGEIADASILVAMGNDTADVSLNELQGRVPPADESTADESTAEETTDESVPEESSDEATGDG